jgi:uncharacterized protein YndB with AHSA1/START domain
MHDDVTRKITVSATPWAAWVALTDPAIIAGWFGDSAQVDLRVGGSVRFTWPAGEVSQGVVVTAEEPTRFAFRWDVFGTITDPTRFTTVEFTIRPVAAGTTVQVRETGLRALVEAGIAPNAEDLVEEHVDGWRNEMADLATLLESRPPATHSDLDASTPRASAIGPVPQPDAGRAR